MTREKLTVAVTVKLSDADADALDRVVRRREREANVPLSRALVLRELMRAQLEEEHAEEPEARARA